MTNAEEVIEALRAGRLCTLCNLGQPADWSLDLCHSCLHQERSGQPINVLARRCMQCADAYFLQKTR